MKKGDIMGILKICKMQTFLVSMIMMVILLCCSSQVQAAQSGDFTYTVTEGKAQITKYTGVIGATKDVTVTGVKLNKKVTSVNVGANEILIATIAPTNATNQNITWKSSNTAIGTVDSKGNVAGVKAGTATITVTTVDGKKTATCKVTVKSPPTVKVKKVSLNKKTTSMDIGASEILTATIAPTNATNKDVTWKSSKTSVATVDLNGKVVGVSAGTTVITVTTVDGKKTATCTVVVSSDKESNPNYITIKSVTPSVALQDNSETDFTIVVSYGLTKTAQGEINVGFNTGNAYNRYTITKKVIVDKGSGKMTIFAHAKVKNWAEIGGFKAYANLSEYPHPDNWTPLDYDTFLLKVE